MNIITLQGVSKVYASTGVLAVDRADFSIRSGEVHALVGENGAGKSTLAKILSGFETPDSGSVEVFGKRLKFSSHRDAERAGIGFVPQHSMLAGELTVAQNMALGHEPRRFGLFYDTRKAEVQAMLIAERFGFSIDVSKPVNLLSAASRREAEILRALARGVRILVLDEPTTVLSEGECAHLFSLIRRLKEAGTGIVYISHRAREILEIADRVSVMRFGRVERTESVSSLDEVSLASMIVQGAESACLIPGIPKPGDTVLSLDAVSVHGRGADSLVDVSLSVSSGEIVGIAALNGNGLETLEKVCAGLLRPHRGTVRLSGAAYPGATYASGKKIAYIPSDREVSGLCLKSTVRENISAGQLASMPRLRLLRGQEPGETARRLLGYFSISAELDHEVDSLSGGNRQRLVAARELHDYYPFILAANPVQGLDTAAREHILARLLALRDEGAAILLMSPDADDLAQVANRSFVLYRGTLRELVQAQLHTTASSSGFAAMLTGGAQ